MAKMTAAEAAVYVLEKEGVTQLFGIPGAGINPLYAALKKHGTMKHTTTKFRPSTKQRAYMRT